MEECGFPLHVCSSHHTSFVGPFKQDDVVREHVCDGWLTTISRDGKESEGLYVAVVGQILIVAKVCWPASTHAGLCFFAAGVGLVSFVAHAGVEETSVDKCINKPFLSLCQKQVCIHTFLAITALLHLNPLSVLVLCARVLAGIASANAAFSSQAVHL